MVSFPAGTTKIGRITLPPLEVRPAAKTLPAPAKTARVPHTPGQMNKTEAAYAEYLQRLIAIKEVTQYWFEPAKFRLANRCTYCPDFMVLTADGTIEIHEVKGHMEDDAAVKLRVFSEQFPFPVYVIKRYGGYWIKVRWK